MSDHYMLAEDGKTPVKTDLMMWARSFDGRDRIVARDELPDGVSVSTVFLGLDHNFMGKGPPVLWETMIFGGEHDEYQERYTSHDDAVAGHAKAVSMCSGRAERPHGSGS